MPASEKKSTKRRQPKPSFQNSSGKKADSIPSEIVLKTDESLDQEQIKKELIRRGMAALNISET